MSNPRTSPGRLGEIRFINEATPGATIASPSSFWSSSYKKQHAFDIQAQLKKNSEDDPSMQTHFMVDPVRLLTNKGGSLSWKCFLTGLAQTAADTTPVTSDDLGLLLKTAFGGGETLGTTTTVAAPGTGTGATTPIVVASAAGLTVGGAVCISGECRRIVGISGTNVTLDMDLSTAPPASTLCIAAATYYPKQTGMVDLSDAGHVTLAALFRGYDVDDQWQVRGGFPEIDLVDIGPNKIPKLQVNLHAMDWDLVSGVAVGSVFSEGAAPAQLNSGLYLANQGTVTLTQLHVKAIDIKLGLKPDEIMSPTAQQGILGHAVFGGRTQVNFEAFFRAQLNTDFEAGTKKYGGLQIGRPSTSQGAILISFPQLVIDETPTRGGSGATGSQVKAHADAGPLLSTSDLAGARFAIHRFPHL